MKHEPRPVANFVKVAVQRGYGASDAEIQLATGQGARLPDPAAGAYNLVWFNATDYVDPADDPNVEIVRAVALSGDALTVIRAQEGTAASQKQNLGKIYKLMLGLTAKMIADLQASGSAGGTPVENEIVSGSGTGWTLASMPISGSVRLYAGTRLIPGVGQDFTIVGQAIATANPYPAGALLADYRISS